MSDVLYITFMKPGTSKSRGGSWMLRVCIEVQLDVFFSSWVAWHGRPHMQWIFAALCVADSSAFSYVRLHPGSTEVVRIISVEEDGDVVCRPASSLQEATNLQNLLQTIYTTGVYLSAACEHIGTQISRHHKWLKCQTSQSPFFWYYHLSVAKKYE